SEKDQAQWERSRVGAEPIYSGPSRALEAAFPFEELGNLKEGGGKVSLCPGRLGQAAAFDGAVHLEAGDIAKFDIEDPFTISAWVDSETTPAGNIARRMADTPTGRGYGVHPLQRRV